MDPAGSPMQFLADGGVGITVRRGAPPRATRTSAESGSSGRPATRLAQNRPVSLTGPLRDTSARVLVVGWCLAEREPQPGTQRARATGSAGCRRTCDYLKGSLPSVELDAQVAAFPRRPLDRAL